MKEQKKEQEKEGMKEQKKEQEKEGMKESCNHSFSFHMSPEINRILEPARLRWSFNALAVSCWGQP